ncbi:hypothetical protein, partial [Shigella flexneri]|uniref:hypothetical protein n=1 Tax=Shigella flexneri TaxID=623 RepID=UPI001C0A8D3C
AVSGSVAASAGSKRRASASLAAESLALDDSKRPKLVLTPSSVEAAALAASTHTATPGSSAAHESLTATAPAAPYLYTGAPTSAT